METKSKFKTDFLVPKSSFISGYGSVISIGGWNHQYNKSNNPDRKALENDWGVVGDDLKRAIAQTKLLTNK